MRRDSRRCGDKGMMVGKYAGQNHESALKDKKERGQAEHNRREKESNRSFPCRVSPSWGKVGDYLPVSFREALTGRTEL